MAAHVNRDLTGLDFQASLETWTGIPTGYNAAPPSGQGDDVDYPYLIVYPHPAEITLGRALLGDASGAEFHYDLRAVGTVDRQSALALDAALTELLDPGNVWVGTSPAPVKRRIVGYGPAGKDQTPSARAPAGVRWTSAEVILGVLN